MKTLYCKRKYNLDFIKAFRKFLHEMGMTINFHENIYKLSARAAI